MPNDPLVAVGTTMLRQSGANYLESGKRYMQSWTGVLSGAMLQHHFDISSSYGACPDDCLESPGCRRKLSCLAEFAAIDQ